MRIFLPALGVYHTPFVADKMAAKKLLSAEALVGILKLSTPPGCHRLAF
jgi:hypothetical protein